SLTVLEQSLTVKDNHDRPLSYHYILNVIRITVEVDKEVSDSVEVCYTTLPYSLHKVYSKRTLMEDYDSTALFKDNRKVASEAIDFREEIFFQNNLNKSGSMTRGISFGNTQNVFVNSNLNLQMEGQLTDELNIRASITDQN